MRRFFALRHSRDEIAAGRREESACRQEACCAFLLLPIASRWNVRGSAAVTIAIVICALTWGHGLRAVWMSTVVPRFGASAACNCPENDLIFQCIRRYIGTGWRIFML